MPPILHSVRQQARKQLAELLRGLFNNVDDALFEMADRSRSDADQSMYFESMREIRLHRQRIFDDFAVAFGRSFEVIFRKTALEEGPEDLDSAVDGMSLLKNDELEISVAIAGIVSKVTSQHSLAVMQLTKRIDYLCQQNTVTERMNPLGPESLSRAFVAAIEGLEIDIKVRIILLKLFERFVMERLAAVYSGANELLIDAGVLPDLKNLMRNRPGTSASRRSERGVGTDAPGAGEAYGAGPAGAAGGRGTGSGGGAHAGASSAATASGGRGFGFGVIQRLLAASRSADQPPIVDGPVLSTSDLVSVLSAAQTDLTAPINIEEVPPLLDLHQVVVNRAPDVTGAALSRLDQADNDVVNFVGMLFDYILNDRNLAIPMKALIGRLQLPIVKLAVMDKSFFDKTSHPARQLLNELSSAGIGWSSAAELKRDALYNKIESVVLRVMNGFADNPDIFEELVEELRQFVGQDQRKRGQLEERVKATETGKAKTHCAKEQVQQLINQKASGLRLPPDVGRFISDVWSRVLVYASVTEGEHSNLWLEGVQTLDDLLWSLQPLDNLEDADKRDQLLEALLGSLARGMSTIKLAPEEASTHHDCIYKHLHEISRNDRAFLEDDEHPEPAPAPPAPYEVMEEIVLTSPEENLDPPDIVPPEPEYLAQIGTLKEGVWVELMQDDGERLRCKLAAIVEPGPRYVFVNRRGMKVLEKSRMGLAVELKRKTLTVLAESQVFDRALQAVIGNLRTMHREPSPLNSG